jgi:hypothetical protein
MNGVKRRLEREPVPPGQINPLADRDLETICLKYMQKDPQQRYGSAADDADGIGRYQRGEPLSVRPISPFELLWRWHTRLRSHKKVRVRSTSGIGSIPWVDIAIDPDQKNGQLRGVARGIVAIGDTSWGIVPYGDFARVSSRSFVRPA